MLFVRIAPDLIFREPSFEFERDDFLQRRFEFPREMPEDFGRSAEDDARSDAVRLAAPCDLLVVGEGIETCLAVMQATGHLLCVTIASSGGGRAFGAASAHNKLPTGPSL